MVDDVVPRVRVVGRVPGQLVADAAAVIAVVAVVAGLAGSRQIGGALAQPVTDQILTVLAAVVGACAALLGGITAHLAGDRRVRWIAAALTLYAVIVLPVGAFVPNGASIGNPEGLRLVGYFSSIVLLICAARPPRRVGAFGTWLLAGVGAAVALVFFIGVPTSGELIRSPAAAVAMLLGWTAVAVAVVVEGYRRNTAARWRAGLGLVVVAGAQLVRLLIGSQPPTFAALRLVGLLVVAIGFAQLLLRTVAELDDRTFAHQEELVTAALHMEKAAEAAAERDHELRNGLAGLAGITHLLSAGSDDEQHQRLKHAVLAELGRLHKLVDGLPAPADDRPVYAVAPVVDGLVALRRLVGADITAEIEPGLHACGDPAVLAQVITNLLANCDRHAPGADVVIRAHAEGDAAVIEVRDAGPGLPAGPAEHLLDRGVRDADAGGLGLGLNISRDLVESQGGNLGLRAAGPDGGCVARVSLPLVRAAQPVHPGDPTHL